MTKEEERRVLEFLCEEVSNNEELQQYIIDWIKQLNKEMCDVNRI